MNMFWSICSVTLGVAAYPMKYVPNSPRPTVPNAMLSRRIWRCVPSGSMMVLSATWELSGFTSSASSTFDSFLRPMTSSWPSTLSAFHRAVSWTYFWTMT